MRAASARAVLTTSPTSSPVSSVSCAVPHQQAPVDQHVADVAALRGVDQRRDRIGRGRDVWSARDRPRSRRRACRARVEPTVGLEAERARAAERRELDASGRGQRARPDARLVEQRGEPQLDEAVEVVVAGRAVGAERDRRRPRRSAPGSARCPSASLRFDDGQWQTCAPRCGEQARSSSVRWIAVRDARVRAEQAELVEDDDVVLAEPLADERDLAAVLARVGVDARRRAPSPARRPRAAARRCTTARTAARTRSAADRRRRRASARSAARTRRARRCVVSRRPGGICGSPRVHHRLADRRADAGALGAPRRSRRCDAPCPCRGSRWCRRAAARRTRARAARRAASSSSAASYGQMTLRSQSSSSRSSARPRASVWHVWTCAWTRPGITTQPAQSRIV